MERPEPTGIHFDDGSPKALIFKKVLLYMKYINKLLIFIEDVNNNDN